MKEKIPASEWKVMEVLWQEPNIMASLVVDRLADTKWSDKTIKTLLARLVKKGLIAYTKEGKSYRYYPMVEKELYIMEERKAFINKVFGGSNKAFLTNFIKSETMTKEDIDDLRALLDSKEDDDESI